MIKAAESMLVVRVELNRGKSGCGKRLDNVVVVGIGSCFGSSCCFVEVHSKHGLSVGLRIEFLPSDGSMEMETTSRRQSLTLARVT